MNALPSVNPLFGNPFLWVILAGLLVGAALAFATRRASRSPNPDRARTRKWVAACVLLSLAVIVGLLAVFVPGPSKILDVRLAWAAGAAALVAFGALRFKKALGIPVVVLLVGIVILFGLFLQSVHAFTGETEIATVRVISVDATSMRLELVARGSEPVLLTMKGTYFAPVVKVVIFNDLYVLLGAKTWYRFEAMSSFDDKIRQQDTDYQLPQPLGISEKIWNLFEDNETRIPGVKTTQIDLALKKVRPNEFTTYGIRIQNDGGVEIVPE
jgi:hypothetical protein